MKRNKHKCKEMKTPAAMSYSTEHKTSIGIFYHLTDKRYLAFYDRINRSLGD